MTRLAFVLIDGLGDVSLPGLGYRTPLQVARTPALDAIAGSLSGVLLGTVAEVTSSPLCGLPGQALAEAAFGNTQWRLLLATVAVDSQSLTVPWCLQWPA